jgi:hypothetical protein
MRVNGRVDYHWIEFVAQPQGVKRDIKERLRIYKPGRPVFWVFDFMK